GLARAAPPGRLRQLSPTQFLGHLHHRRLISPPTWHGLIWRTGWEADQPFLAAFARPRTATATRPRDRSDRRASGVLEPAARWRRGLGGLRRDVAFIFQEQRLLPRLNAFENIVFALQLRDPQVPNKVIEQRALEALESVKLAHRRRAYPHELSAGERQRVAVARALATRPRVLLADEPLASMDDQNAAIITHLLEDAAAKGTTVIVASHKHSFAATRVLRLPSERVMTNGVKRPTPMNGNAYVNGAANGNGNHNGNGHTNGASTPRAWWRMAIPARTQT